jgi:hypothetical protein
MLETKARLARLGASLRRHRELRKHMFREGAAAAPAASLASDRAEGARRWMAGAAAN